jgi:hypothetical protein
MAARQAVRAQTVDLRGKKYVMVAGRVLIAHDDNPDGLSITGDIVFEDDKLIRFKATVLTRKGTFNGYAESDKIKGEGVEKQSPLEVAETSAVGRALGFAGYAVEDGIASAEEMQEAERRKVTRPATAGEAVTQTAPAPVLADVPKDKPAEKQAPAAGPAPICSNCNQPIAEYANNERKLSPQEIADKTTRTHGRALCVTCSTKVGRK